MGHFVFIVLHLIAFLFLSVALFVTVPLHLMYAVLAKRSTPDSPTPRTHVSCPTCRELVHKEATKCRYCGQALVPASAQ